MDHFDITIIGAGVVGLAIAERLYGDGRDVLVVERHPAFGQETSSRNSEVIHAGLYYPAGSLKARLCREGNRLLYEACEKRGIPHRRVGKLIVATNEAEVALLHQRKAMAEANDVTDLRFLSRKEIAAMEPDIRVREALYSPSTGIIDSHALMRFFFINAESNGVTMAFRTEVTAARPASRGYEIESNRGEYRFSTGAVINSAGLQSDRIAAMAGIDVDKAAYRLKYCKGSYFTASPAPVLRHLVYPVPTPNHEGLGIHATIDLAGRVRFGPDVEYVSELDYRVDEKRRADFAAATQTYLPLIRQEALEPDMCGIRPKLQGPGEAVRDFVIQEEGAAGLPGWINLIGIESPGLTSCLAIADRVKALVDQL